MKDILDNITDIDYKLKRNEQEKKIRKESKKILLEKEAEQKKIDFQLKFEKLKNDAIVQEYLFSKFNNINTTAADRINTNNLMIETLQRLSKQGKIPKSHDLYISEKYAKNLKSTSNQLFRELVDTNLKLNIDTGTARANEAQGVLNDLAIGKRGNDVTEGTANNHKLRIQKLNLLECLATGYNVDYSSGIRTKFEINQYNQEPKIHNETNRQFKSSQYERAKEGILSKLKENPEKVTDAEVAFILCGDFMFRISTVRALPIEQINIAAGTIEVYEHQNKSQQSYLATGSYLAPQRQDFKETLSLIVQRAKIRNSDKKNEDGTIPLITATEAFLYNGGYNKILRDYKIKGNWKGKYHSLRHMGAQNRYDEIRAAIEEEALNTNAKSTSKMQIEALVELNYALGHSSEHIDTTMSYVKNIW